MTETESVITQCPKCGRRLCLFYSMDRQLVVCQCLDPDCALHSIEGTGDNTLEAMKDFQVKAKKGKR